MPIFEKIFGEEQTKEILTKVGIELLDTCIQFGLTSLQSTSDEVKKLLIAKTDEALAEGSFGLPWYVGEYLDLGQASP